MESGSSGGANGLYLVLKANKETRRIETSHWPIHETNLKDFAKSEFEFENIK